MNSTSRIGQLNALRFKMQSVEYNLHRRRSAEISENEIRGMRKAIPKGGLTTNTVALIGGVGIGDIENMELP